MRGTHPTLLKWSNMNFLQINEQLSRHLAAFSMPDVRVHWENTPIVYRPNQTETVIGAKFLPNEINQIDFCMGKTANGLYSLNLYAPKDRGHGQGLAVADALFTHFADERLGAVRCETPTLANVGEVGDFFVFNVSVPWYAKLGE